MQHFLDMTNAECGSKTAKVFVIGATAHCPHYTQHFSNPVDVTAPPSRPPPPPDKGNCISLPLEK